MDFENLYIELTRQCTMQCEHCLRGERENKSMSIQTLENIFQDINHIGVLLLTGGEPLINIKAIEHLAKIIKERQIKVDNIGLITNGTILSPRHIKGLKELESNCDSFQFFLSNDLFHRQEWNRLGLTRKVDRNFEVYQKFFPIKRYLDNDSYHRVVLQRKGRARYISDERIQELRQKNHIAYRFDTEEDSAPLSIVGTRITGKACVDVYGSFVPYNKSFQEEDNLSMAQYNVNNRPVSEFIGEYIGERTPKTYKK